MAFDAGMLSAVVQESNMILGEANSRGGSKVEKVYMPERDEIDLVLRTYNESFRFVLSASPNTARVLISDTQKENPATPPSLCMLLRKKLMGARLVKISQMGFERVCCLEFDTKDEMGYAAKRFLVAEIMGKHSNIILCDADFKILGAIRTVDATSSLTRRIIPGIKYEMPPLQDKLDPTQVSETEFASKLSSYEPSAICDKAIVASFSGIAPIIAREICYRATGEVSSTIANTRINRLWEEFAKYFDALKKGEFAPTLLFEEGKDSAFEYSVYPILQYGEKIKLKKTESVSSLIDEFFSLRDKSDRHRQRSQDILKLLTNAENRLTKKIEAQKNELVDADDMEQCRLYGDLISQEMYRVKKGDRFVEALDYSKEPYETVKIELDEKLTPSQNAQRYYKKYNRKKKAKEELVKQIEASEKELSYIATVFDALTRAESEKDLAEIREELSIWGYMRREAKKLRTADKKQNLKPMTFTSPSGYEVLVGKNNLQNDYITTKLSQRGDWWFHTKNYPGSHVLMCVGKDEDPPAEDFTFACELAAEHSSAEGDNIAVDYTQIRYIKKPSGSKPGFVTYTTYWTAYVSPKRNK